MASYDPIIRMNDNAFRGPEKVKSKVGRKPLGDVTNSSKPLGKPKPSSKTSTVFNGAEKVQTKVARKPLGDLTNSHRPQRAQEKSSKKNCVENVSAVNERELNSWIKEERFLHNHNECVKAQMQSSTMSMDYFLETVGLKKDSSVSSRHNSQIRCRFPASEPELEAPTELEEFETDICAPISPPTPKAPESPNWNIDWKNLKFSPVKLKDSPLRY